MHNFPFPIQHNVSLSKLSTFAIGGVAKNYIPVENRADLVKVLNYLYQKRIAFKIFAGGSNVVFPDKDLPLPVIHLQNGLTKIIDHQINADAAASLKNVIDLAIYHGLAGLESLSGIPGSVGGAVVGNAGAYGSSISDVINKVEIWHQGQIKWLTQKECDFSYRESLFKHKPFYILRIVMTFIKSDRQKLEKISNEIIEIRKQKYKPGLKCPGSFFKNILVKDLSPKQIKKIGKEKIVYGKIPAGYLLESVGAKSLKVGDIEIASFHGNLFINKGQGSARDVKELAKILKKKVYQKYGILLEEEIRYL